MAILVAIAVNEDGYREILGVAEGMKEDKASWVSFFQWLRGRSLDGVKLVTVSYTHLLSLFGHTAEVQNIYFPFSLFYITVQKHY